jgi:TPR repeat protein
MKRAILAVLCCAALLANAGGAAADAVSDQDMASRYLQAAKSGNDEAQFYLGALYSAGVGVPRSDEEAYRWFSRAADQGHAHAMLVLAGLYAVGRGVEKDNIKAYKWAYIINGASRVEEYRNGARQLIGVLEGKMSADDINYARQEANRWRATPSGKPTQSAAPPAPPPAAPSQAASPQAASAAPPAPATAQPPAKTSTESASGKKNDVDSLLDQVPSGLRKKFGF